MKLTCPACNETLSLAALIEHDAAREAIGTALKMPAPLGKYLLQYLGFFKPAKSALSLDKVAKILADLLPMLSAGKVSKNGTVYAAPQDYWAQAIETMMSNRAALTLPLKSHGYLISIIAGYAEKVGAKKEAEAEKGRRYGEIQTCTKSQTSDIQTASSAQKNNCHAGLDSASQASASENSATAKQIAGQARNDKKRAEMPADVQATIRKMTGKTSHAK